MLPYAIGQLELDNVQVADSMPTLLTEYFAPVSNICRLSVADKLTSDQAATLEALRERAQGAVEPPELSGEEVAALRAMAAAFLQEATALLNEHVWGTLVVSVFVDPETQEALADDVQRAVDSLEYGSVVVNGPTYLAYGAASGFWGGFQGEDTDLKNVRSGYGWIGNLLRFDHPQKQALYCDFASPAQPQDAKLPPWAARPLAGLLGGGLGGLWHALT
jgi:molybdopterin converting factor small subunit